MKSRLPLAPASFPVSALRSAPIAVLAAAVLVGACGGGGGDDGPSSGAIDAPAAPSEGDPTDVVPAEVDMPGTEAPENAPSDTVPPEPDPMDVGPSLVNDDGQGLRVRLPEGSVAAELASPWLAAIDVFQVVTRPDTTGDVYVELVRYTDDLSIEEHADFYRESFETCEIFDLGSDDGDGGQTTEFRRNVSGGDAVSLSSAGGAFASAPFSEAREAYVGDDVLPTAVPDDLTLSLPGGAEFPAIDGLPLVAPSNAPERLSPAIGEAVTVDTEYRWVAGEGNRIQVDFAAFDASGEFLGFPVGCYVEDDGEFVPSEDALALIADYPDELRVRYSREWRQLEFRDGVALFHRVLLADD